MKSLLVLTLFGFTATFAAGASLCDGIAGNLLTNCGFETGDFTGWTVVDGTDETFVAGPTMGVGVNSGNFFAALGAVGADGSLSQTLGTVPGQTYNFGFWLASDGDLQNDFTAMWDATSVLSLTSIPATPYTFFSFSETAAAASTTITFLGRNDAGFLGLDDVSVVGPAPAATAPEPGTFGSCLLLGLVTGGTILTRRHKAPFSLKM
jgi:hypothetical protein